VNVFHTDSDKKPCMSGCIIEHKGTAFEKNIRKNKNTLAKPSWTITTRLIVNSNVTRRSSVIDIIILIKTFFKTEKYYIFIWGKST